uniref:C3H1-type domain-containing protein n=1 Tax=Eptatretus burgeri TaxID=7764 RepID=A0A8C4ND24_EPTBU
MSKVRRKVTVESSKTFPENPLRRPSVFERLGLSGGGSTGTPGGSGASGTPSKSIEVCRNWLKGCCNHGSKCKYSHVMQTQRGKGYRSGSRRSPERMTTDLRERMWNRRQDMDEGKSRQVNHSPSAGRRASLGNRQRDKDEASIKIVKARTPDSEEDEEGGGRAWADTRDGAQALKSAHPCL